ncbi:MAG: hypothetical protein ACK5LR_12390 [Mangrovibacterium sp.]
MKNKYFVIGLFLVSVVLGACGENESEENPIPDNGDSSFVKEYILDTETNLKNPYMGWSLYSEGGQQTDKPAMYWYLQNPASDYAGTLYIRWRWSDLEPEEGQYAWDNNEDFKGMIQGAVDRGLRIAFRIYVNGRDNLKPATPQFVLDGAATYTVAPGHLTPYADDEFFLEKYTNFIAAFGAKFNDPSLVDYVDSYGLGFWGEEHNIQYQNSANKYTSHNKIVRAYAQAFDKVINVINYGARDATQQAVAYDELGFSPRRDGYASTYFPVSQQTGIVAHFPSKIIIAEACYWKDASISTLEGGKWSNWAAYYKDVVSLAINTHANYLDLRTYTESSRYMDVAMDQVKRFIAEGGYRIYPKTISCDYKDGTLDIEHTWVNVANGVLPNNNVSLGYKYKVAFALFDSGDNLVEKWESDDVEVSDLVDQKEISANESIDLSEISKGNYKLAVAIINTRENDSKDIALAIKDATKISGEWVLVGDIQIK